MGSLKKGSTLAERRTCQKNRRARGLGYRSPKRSGEREPKIAASASRRSDARAGTPRGFGRKSDWIAAANVKDDEVSGCGRGSRQMGKSRNLLVNKRARQGRIDGKTIPSRAWTNCFLFFLNLNIRVSGCQPADRPPRKIAMLPKSPAGSLISLRCRLRWHWRYAKCLPK